MKSFNLKLVLLLSCLVSTQLMANEQDDPYESFNRKMFAVHEVLDQAIKPAAELYDQYAPLPFRVSFKSTLSNLGEPLTATNNALQGKGKSAISDLGRFVINSTLGIFGLFDVASEMNINKNDEDFGQTLAVWGVPEGGYVFLPLLGPRTLRDTFAFAVDSQLGLSSYVLDSQQNIAKYTFQALDIRASLLGLDTMLSSASDKYIFLRNAYLQNRRAAIRDGVPISAKKVEDQEDFYDASSDGDATK